MNLKPAQVLTVHGVKTPVFEAGAGRPVVFLHGNPDTHSVWEPVIPHLGAGLRCIAPDLPGFGGSEVSSSFEFSLENQAAWVEKLFDGLGLQTADLVVHDVGGIYGLAFATKFRSRLRSLTIMNTSFFRDNQWHFWARMWRLPIVGEVVMATGNRWLFVNEMLKGSPGLPRAYANEAWDAFRMPTRRAVLRWYRAMTYPEVLPGWDDALVVAIQDLPRQVIWGDLDPYIVPATADRYQAPVHRLPDCGHWAMQERPEEVARWISELLRAS